MTDFHSQYSQNRLYTDSCTCHASFQTRPLRFAGRDGAARWAARACFGGAAASRSAAAAARFPTARATGPRGGAGRHCTDLRPARAFLGQRVQTRTLGFLHVPAAFFRAPPPVEVLCAERRYPSCPRSGETFEPVLQADDFCGRYWASNRRINGSRPAPTAHGIV